MRVIRAWALAVSLIAIALACSATGARAQYVSVFTTSGVNDFTLNQTSSDSHDFNHTTAPLYLIPATVSSSAALSGGDANGFATGSMGTLKAYAFSESPADPNILSQTHDELNALDYIHVQGLPAGAPVDILFTMIVNGTHSDPEFVPGGSYSNEAVASLVENGPGSNALLKFDSHLSSPTVQSTMIVASVGDLLTVGYSLDAVTYVAGSSPILQAFEDYASTAHFYVDAETPGASLVSASGFDYARPQGPAPSVPEPGALSLVAGSIAAGTLVALRRRRR